MVSGRRVQRRYSLSETTLLNRVNLRGMVHKSQSLIFNILLHVKQLHIFIYSIVSVVSEYITFLVHCCRPPLEPADRTFSIYCDVTSLSRNQFVNLSCNIPAGFMVIGVQWTAYKNNIDIIASNSILL